MKPLRAFLFLSSVLLLLFLVSFYQSNRSQEQLHTPVAEVIPEDSISIEDVLNEPLAATDSVELDDRLSIASEPEISDSISSFIPSSGGFVFADGDSLHFSAIADKLGNPAPDKQQIRIFYIGDSQIESDHITSALRKGLQNRYGGQGPGLIAPDQYYNPPHQLIMTMSENWQNQSMKDMRGKNKSILFKNSLAVKGEEDNAWFRINRLRFLTPQEDFNQIRLFLYATDTSTVEILRSGQSIFQNQITAANELHDLSIPLKNTPDDLKLTFAPKDSLYVTGFSLESESGIFVDNIALRGLSYPPFSSSDRSGLKTMTDMLQPDLFVLQFGVNVVPYFSENYTIFRSQFNRQIRIIRQLCPGVPILVIGVSDMAHREDGELVSYENIEQIKQIQFDIAMRNHCAFWDLEAFMGGIGSMASWVNADPPMGRKDFVHFTEKGAEKIGSELANLFISEFETSRLTAWKSN
ncbi:GDSL-type esterase/lipase family protein [Mangrovibacterium diazotrophicum]|uniref:GDSL-like lipase/acylhydrolase family protein n=1 Tax=Mangrovibacterium diazotrophicum TaxID=1261403 RepID=A0A419W7Q1_9BACT|nr:GDSL-type esterase/lipase family protein [Mangrovibacterium diazotrophicum]RKD91489.1 GDSL-like lipase/acylhydrolase family protein [Mangrovibacterium diazotrophicum]